ncbi:MAG: hypothetical protein DRP09_22015 [Candidatus Thorarchaeota archaeon]|nr:MAG: hypothetical protein DRP09_22015 [Candidatus Thorarchaeota archaeon]
MQLLDKLREEVKVVDREIMRLVGKRVALVRAIGEEKREKGIPLRNWEVEKSVMENVEHSAEEFDITVSLVKSIMHRLVEESRIEQERLHYSACTEDEENILIIGGRGEMGRWFCSFFQNQGHNPSVYDLSGVSKQFKSYRNLQTGLQENSFILIATPLDQISLVINDITELGYKGVVFDIASLKAHLRDSINHARENGISITSIHPMFGPYTRTLSDKVICLCDCGDDEANERVKSLFQNTSADIVRLTLEEHDHLISYVLGLSHIINVVFIKSLVNSGYTYSQLKNVASTTFLAQMETVQSVIEENPLLYYAIQRLNPFKEELYKNLKEAVDCVITAVLKGDGKKFSRIMEQGRRWLEMV